ncbi:MAG TPA: hypothetical protein VJN70_20415 [Gemmatimonadaceae bacterium]|nr:hypothetical protein [Gemmatimonadaceae bacterium]
MAYSKSLAAKYLPSGIGAQAYFAQFGIDFEAVKRDAARRHEAGPETKP